MSMIPSGTPALPFIYADSLLDAALAAIDGACAPLPDNCPDRPLRALVTTEEATVSCCPLLAVHWVNATRLYGAGGQQKVQCYTQFQFTYEIELWLCAPVIDLSDPSCTTVTEVSSNVYSWFWALYWGVIGALQGGTVPNLSLCSNVTVGDLEFTGNQGGCVGAKFLVNVLVD